MSSVLNAWQYRGKDFDPSLINEETAGFVYCLTNTVTGKKYIGKKVFWSITRKPPLKGYKRKRIIKKHSDWTTYIGSSKSVKKEFDEYGKGSFTREILAIGRTRAQCNSMELYLLVLTDCLHALLPNGERMFLNENIERVLYQSNTLPVQDLINLVRKNCPHIKLCLV